MIQIKVSCVVTSCNVVVGYQRSRDPSRLEILYIYLVTWAHCHHSMVANPQVADGRKASIYGSWLQM
jgi:hypothetical protein